MRQRRRKCRQATFVYHHADSEAAKANAKLIEAAFTDGISLVNNRPMSEMFDVKSVEVDGDVVVATATLKESRPSNVWQVVVRQDLPTTHR